MKWHHNVEPSMWLRGEIARVRRVPRSRCEHLRTSGRSVLPVIALWAPEMGVCSACFPPVSTAGGMADHDHRCDRCGAVDHGDFHPLFTDTGWALVVLGLCRLCFRKEIPDEAKGVRP